MRRLLALVTLATARALSAHNARWKPYLDPAEPPLKDSQVVLRFINVPPSAADINPPSADCKDFTNVWQRDQEVVIVTGRTFPTLQVAQSVGINFPRGKLKAPYHQDTMADCCMVEMEDPDWLDPAHPRYDWMQGQGGRRGFRRVRACDVDGPGGRVDAPPGREMVLDFAIQALVLEMGFTDPAKRFEGDWEADFVGGSGGGRQWQKRKEKPLGKGARMAPIEDDGFSTESGIAPWDVIQ
mmetsp:Transcript_20968/g.62549  ORF Transcript_20968/g.62549 Transcript_20968/m.62549 type:complete len:240 (+) Transcript_20968:1356-2075(+)